MLSEDKHAVSVHLPCVFVSQDSFLPVKYASCYNYSARLCAADVLGYTIIIRTYSVKWFTVHWDQRGKRVY